LDLQGGRLAGRARPGEAGDPVAAAQAELADLAERDRDVVRARQVAVGPQPGPVVDDVEQGVHRDVGDRLGGRPGAWCAGPGGCFGHGVNSSWKAGVEPRRPGWNRAATRTRPG